MSEPMLGEIRVFPMGWAPVGWLPCDGRQLPISGNQALYSLLGNTYGGDLKTVFNLPDLRGRVGVGADSYATSGTPYPRGAKGGAESVTLTAATVPSHMHMVAASTANATAFKAEGAYPATLTVSSPTAPAGAMAYGAGPATVALAAGSIQTVGGGQAHNNIQPSLVVNVCICTSGVYPMRP